MKKNKFIFFLLSILLVFSACSSNSKESSQMVTGEDNSVRFESNGGMYDEMEVATEDAYPEEAGGTADYVESLDIERKIIVTAHMDMQTKEFDFAKSEIENIVENNGGYIEASSLSENQNGKDRYLSLTLRIPAKDYQYIKKQIEGVGKVLNYSENQEDETGTYQDLNEELNILKDSEARLSELLNSATEISDIISIEEKLSYIRSDINFYTSQLENIDDKASYSTIYLRLQEISNAELDVEMDGFGQDLINGLKSSVNITANIFKTIIICAAYLFFPVLIIAVIVIVIIKIIKKRRKKINNGK